MKNLLGLSDDRVKQAILMDRLEMLFQRTPSTLIATIATALLTSAVLYTRNPALTPGWFLLLSLVAFTYLFLARRFVKSTVQAEHLLPWIFLLIICDAFLGMMWGLLPLLFYVQGDIIFLLFIGLLFCAMVAVSMVSSGPYSPPFIAFATTCLAPLALVLAQSDELELQLLGALTVVLIVLSIIINLSLQQSIIKTLNLQYENTTLIDQLLEQKNKAIEANQAKTRFLAAASHDLRQPIHALGLMLSALEKFQIMEKSQQLLSNAQTANHNLEALLGTLLDISKLDAGVVRVHKRAFSLDTLMQAVAGQLRSSAAEKGIDLHVKRCGLWVNSDPLLVQQILLNLLGNAIKYTPSGKIILGCRRGEKIRLQVLDSGIGIAIEHQQTIFHEFSQLNNPERDREKGLGLGLSISARLARLLGTRIDLRSTPGKGSCFSIDLVRADAIDTLLHTNEPLSVQNKLNGTRVLIIDDDKNVREAMEEIVTQWGCECYCAASGEDALEHVQIHRPELILSDYRLREHETGVAVIKALRHKLNSNIPAIIVTGDTHPDRIRDIKKSGLMVMHKPVSAPRLKAGLLYLIQQKSKVPANNPLQKSPELPESVS